MILCFCKKPFCSQQRLGGGYTGKGRETVPSHRTSCHLLVLASEVSKPNFLGVHPWWNMFHFSCVQALRPLEKKISFWPGCWKPQSWFYDSIFLLLREVSLTLMIFCDIKFDKSYLVATRQWGWGLIKI